MSKKSHSPFSHVAVDITIHDTASGYEIHTVICNEYSKKIHHQHVWITFVMVTYQVVGIFRGG